MIVFANVASAWISLINSRVPELSVDRNSIGGERMPRIQGFNLFSERNLSLSGSILCKMLKIREACLPI